MPRPASRFRIVAASASVLAVVAVVAALYVLTDKLMFPFLGIDHSAGICRPWHVAKGFARHGSPGVPLEESCEAARARPTQSHFAQTADGRRIHWRAWDNLGAFPAADGRAPLWLFVHGVTSTGFDAARYYQAARRLGFQLVAMDLGNHGLSTDDGRGAAYGCREHADVAAVVADLKKTYPERLILVSASSMGTMAVVNAAETLQASDPEHRVIAYALENPVSSVRDIALTSPAAPPLPAPVLALGVAFAGWRMGCDLDAWAPVARARAIARPTLVQHSRQDEVVPVAMGEALAAAFPPGIPHTLSLWDTGWHSALWNADPARFEREIAALWREGMTYRATHAAGPAAEIAPK